MFRPLPRRLPATLPQTSLQPWRVSTGDGRGKVSSPGDGPWGLCHRYHAWAWGQPLISRTGEIRLWVNSIWSAENSQQVADWYSLSHATLGMFIALIGRGLAPRVSYPAVLALVLVIGVGWEIIEHTDFVLDRFRGQTIYQGYMGDTVLNAVSDYIFMLAGFFAAMAMPARWGLFLMFALEILSATVARDSLLLTTLRVVHPVQVITDWQDETNPVTHPDTPSAPWTSGGRMAFGTTLPLSKTSRASVVGATFASANSTRPGKGRGSKKGEITMTTHYAGGCDHVRVTALAEPIDNHECHCNVCKSVTGQHMTHVVFFNYRDLTVDHPERIKRVPFDAQNPDGPVEICLCTDCNAVLMLDDKGRRIRVAVPNIMGYDDASFPRPPTMPSGTRPKATPLRPTGARSIPACSQALPGPRPPDPTA